MERFTFFWKGELSQWWPSPFVIDGVRYACAEQYMMRQKALISGDAESAAAVLMTNSPRLHKWIGRAVPLNVAAWEKAKLGVVYAGNMAKFTQGPVLRKLLLGTIGTSLAEASPHDRVWGIGLGAEDPRARDRTQWQGENLLGYVLELVRETIAYQPTRRTT